MVFAMGTVQNMTEERSTELSWTNQTSEAEVLPELTSLAPYQASVVLTKVCSPVILALGTFGNSMVLAVLRTIPLGAGGVSVFFSALAISDLTVLYSTVLPRWLTAMMVVKISSLHAVTCKLQVFLGYLCGMTSAWFLVSMTLQRVVSVLWPHRAPMLCTRRKSQVIMAVIVLVLVTLNAHILVVMTVTTLGDDTTAVCDYVDNVDLQNYDYYVFPWLDLVFSSFLPSFLLIVGNTILTFIVYRSVHEAHRMTSQDSATSRRKAASSLTVTLISVSVTYVCLTLPVCGFATVYSFLDVGDDVHYEAWLELIWTLCILLWNCNCAVNFYLYCLTGSKFRAQARRLLCWATSDEAPAAATLVTSKTVGQERSGHGQFFQTDQDRKDF